MVSVYPLARKTHRLLVLLITPLALTMMTTGILLESPALRHPIAVKVTDLLSLHMQVSLVFAAVLSLMLVTGWTMYLSHFFVRRPPPPPTPLS